MGDWLLTCKPFVSFHFLLHGMTWYSCFTWYDIIWSMWMPPASCGLYISGATWCLFGALIVETCWLFFKYLIFSFLESLDCLWSHGDLLCAAPIGYDGKGCTRSFSPLSFHYAVVHLEVRELNLPSFRRPWHCHWSRCFSSFHALPACLLNMTHQEKHRKPNSIKGWVACF